MSAVFAVYYSVMQWYWTSDRSPALCRLAGCCGSLLVLTERRCSRAGPTALTTAIGTQIFAVLTLACCSLKANLLFCGSRRGTLYPLGLAWQTRARLTRLPLRRSWEDFSAPLRRST